MIILQGGGLRFMALDFNLAEYGRMFKSAKDAGYNFISFSEFESVGGRAPGKYKCLLRHDVDIDLSAAFTMANLESDLGISSTYFLMLRSPVYNLMARHNHVFVEKILDLGHSIGLHYDQGFDELRGLTCAQTKVLIEDESQWLEQQFNSRVAAVSFHQPGHAVLQGEICTGDRVNTYDHNRLAGFEYFSDSNRKFPLLQDGSSSSEAVFRGFSPRNLQLLIHPVWWVYDDATTEAVWNRAIVSNLQIMQEQLLETERAYGFTREFIIR